MSARTPLRVSIGLDEIFPQNGDTRLDILKLYFKKMPHFSLEVWSECLLKASKKGDLKAVRLILDNLPKNVTKESIYNCKRDAMHLAVKYEHCWIIEFFLANGVDIEEKSDENLTPLMLAACFGSEKAFKYLLLKGANLYHTDLPVVNYIIQGGSIAILELYQKPFDVDGIHIPSECDYLSIASSFGHLDMVKTLLKRGAKLKKVNNVTPLILAVQNGHLEVVKVLLEAMINQKNDSFINEVDPNGVTALMFAIEIGSETMLKLLIEAGADVNKSNHNKVSPLECACFESNEAIVKALILTKADVNLGSQPPLIVACLVNASEIVKTLILAGANPNIKNGLALSIAVKNNHLSVVSTLLELGADVWMRKKVYNSSIINRIGKLPDNERQFKPISIDDTTQMFLILSTAMLPKLQQEQDLLKEYLHETWLLMSNGFINSQGLHFVFNHFKETLAAMFDGHGDYFGRLVYFGLNENVAELLKLGIKPKEDPRVPHLQLAAQEGHVNVMKTLIAAKMDINGTDMYGATALHTACFHGHLEAVKLLISHRANLDVIDVNNQIPLHDAVISQNEQCIRLIYKSKLTFFLIGSAEYAKLYKENKAKFDELIKLFGEAICEMKPIFDNKAGIELSFVEIKKGKKLIGVKLLAPNVQKKNNIHIPFEIVTKVLMDVFKQYGNEPFNVNDLGLALYNGMQSYKPKSPLDVKSAAENALEQERLKQEILLDLEEEAILNRFPELILPDVNPNLVQVTVVLQEIKKEASEIQDIIEDSDLFLSKPIAGRIKKIGKDIESFKDKNLKIKNRVLNLLTNTGQLWSGDASTIEYSLNNAIGIAYNEVADQKYPVEQSILMQMKALKEKFINHYRTLVGIIREKVSANSLEEAIQLKTQIGKEITDTQLIAYLEEHRKLTEKLVENRDLIIKLRSEMQQKFKFEQQVETEYLQECTLANKLEENEEKERRESERAILQLKLKQEARRKDEYDAELRRRNAYRAQMEERRESHRLKMLQQEKERDLKLAQEKEEQTKKVLARKFKYKQKRIRKSICGPITSKAKDGTIVFDEMENELKFLESFIAEFSNIKREVPLTATELRIETVGFVECSFRLMEAFSGLPQGVGSIEPENAEEFRDVISHAIQLSKFTFEEAYQMSIALLGYLRSIQLNDSKKAAEYWIILVGEDGKLEATTNPPLFLRLMNHDIEDEMQVLPMATYKEQMLNSLKAANAITTECRAHPLLKEFAKAYHLGRAGGFAARIKKWYRAEFLADDSRVGNNKMNYPQIIQEGIKHRHRHLDYSAYLENASIAVATDGFIKNLLQSSHEGLTESSLSSQLLKANESLGAEQLRSGSSSRSLEALDVKKRDSKSDAGDSKERDSSSNAKNSKKEPLKPIVKAFENAQTLDLKPKEAVRKIAGKNFNS